MTLSGPGERKPGESDAPIPAATVVIVRDGAAGLEVLMMHKSKDLKAFGGMWVFPGGRVDDADRVGARDDTAAARQAAVREAAEEADLVIDPDSLVFFAHWLPPGYEMRRFATWFFLAPATEASVTVDGGEIHEHIWLRPTDALAQRDAGEMQFVPPTFVTLSMLAPHATVAAALAWAAQHEPEYFQTRIVRAQDGRSATVWHGDVTYDAAEPDYDAIGPRHRLELAAGPWTYERSGT
jgi:8-oxo-dGTP pyrophosphatase MutT (NUDIX family)